jgi:hypothetical protein
MPNKMAGGLAVSGPSTCKGQGGNLRNRGTGGLLARHLGAQAGSRECDQQKDTVVF